MEWGRGGEMKGGEKGREEERGGELEGEEEREIWEEMARTET